MSVVGKTEFATPAPTLLGTLPAQRRRHYTPKAQSAVGDAINQGGAYSVCVSMGGANGMYVEQANVVVNVRGVDSVTEIVPNVIGVCLHRARMTKAVVF